MLKLKNVSAKRVLLFATLVLALGLLPTAGAAEQKAGQGLEISPPLVQRSVDPGDSFTIEVRLRNITQNALDVTAVVNDFVAKGEEDGQPQLLLDQSDTEVGSYSMRKWVADIPDARIASKEQKTYKVAINVPKNATPGGHYGAVRFTSSPVGAAGDQVSLSGSISNLVLLTVSGDIKTQANVEEFFVGTKQADGTVIKGSFFQKGPVTVAERVNNSGNVHIQPTGSVRITNIFGQEIAKFNVNDTNGNVLPASIRRFDQLLEKTPLLGRYQASLELTYGDGQILTDSLTFWVVPYKLVAIIIAALAALATMLNLGFRRYKKHILNTPAG